MNLKIYLFKKACLKLSFSQKIAIFLYLVFNLYRGFFSSSTFFLFIVTPFLYLFLSEQRRIKGFLRMRAMNTRARHAHYYNDFYWIWQFINFSFIILFVNLLIIYYFNEVVRYLAEINIIFPLTLEQLKEYNFYYFLFVLSINWIIQIYIIWFKNTSTFFKFLATQEVTIGFGMSTYFGLHAYVHATSPETNPMVHYYYHSYEPLLGRRYHFHSGYQIDQSNLVKGAMGNSYNPREFLDKEQYMSSNYFLAYVWANQIEIGAKLTDEQKSKFPNWLTWGSDLNNPDPTVLRDKNTGNLIGRLKYDTNERLFIQFNKGVLVEPYYKPSAFDENDSYNKHQAIVTGYVDKSSTDSKNVVPIISPVQSQDSADSYSSIVSSAGDLSTPNPRRYK